MLPLKITPIGGVNEVGNNCFLYESGNESFLMDCGINPGADVSEKEINERFGFLREKNIRAIIITHIHLDHLALDVALTLTKMLDAPLYVSKIAKLFIERFLYRNHRDKKTYLPRLRVFRENETFNVGGASITPIKMEHSAPEAFSFLIEWNGKKAFHMCDYKLTGYNLESREKNIARLSQIGGLGIDLLVMDTLNIAFPGFTPPERNAVENILRLINEAPGKKHYIFMFASNVRRILAIWNQVKRQARVEFAGASIQKTGKIIDEVMKEWVTQYSLNTHSNTVVLFCTGCQAEEGSFLSWLALKPNELLEHWRISTGDCVYFSSTLIPEENPYLRREKRRRYRHFLSRLASQGAKIFVHSGQARLCGATDVKEENIHVSGHECRDGLKKALKAIAPQWFLPYHASKRYTPLAVDLAKEVSIELNKEIFCLDAKNGEQFTI